MRINRPALWDRIRTGERRALVTRWSTTFEDPFGATIGDVVAVEQNVRECGDDVMSASSHVLRENDGGGVRIATGEMEFTIHSAFETSCDEDPAGPCYSLVIPTPAAWTANALDLLAWQGKCRELFLAYHASDALRRVASQELRLQTSAASVDFFQLPTHTPDEFRIEMRLTRVRSAKFDVRFDYFFDTPSGESRRFAGGKQRIATKPRDGSSSDACPIPLDILVALRGFSASKLRSEIDAVIGNWHDVSSAPQEVGPEPLS